MSQVFITPSILAADFKILQKEVEEIEPHSDWIQIDVMDGHFVPNLSFGAPVAKWIKTSLPLDVHLMVSNPADRIEEFQKIGAGSITFHAETVKSTEDRKALIEKIRDGGAKAGIGINPETPLSEVDDVLDDVDILLVMSVNPGFGGQEFIPEVLEKVKEARERYPDIIIQMDGGVDADSAPKCVEAGANNLVSGSFIFRSEDRKAAIDSLRG